MKILYFILPVFFGSLYAAGFPLFGTKVSFIAGPILGFTGLFYYLDRSRTLKESLFYSLLYSLGFYLTGFYWVPNTLTEFGNIPFPLNHVLGLNALFLISPHIFIFATLLHIFKKKIINQNLQYTIKTLSFLIIQYITPQLFSAYPGHAWMKLAPNLYPAPYFGEYIFSFISILVSFELLHLYREKTFNYVNVLVAFLFFLSCFIPAKKINNKDSINIRVAQANIGNNAKLSAEKGLPNSVHKVLRTYQDLSTKKTEKKIDLIIWPETAYPYSLAPFVLEKDYQFMPRVFKDIHQRMNADIFLGGYLQDRKSKYHQTFNSAFFIHKNKNTKVYNKNKLLPFGESLPFTEGINNAIHSIIPSISFFSKSNSSTLFSSVSNTGTPYRFVGFICYEALSPSLLRKHINLHSKMPQFLINLTNDSWYGETSEPEQHLFLSKWRSVEFNLPMIRSANTGISTIITNDGRELSRTGINKIETLDAIFEFPKKPKKTFFLTWGILPTILFGLSVLIFNIILLRKPFFK